eukprot:3705532-Alexandrium_andersonii.AAC.1
MVDSHQRISRGSPKSHQRVRRGSEEISWRVLEESLRTFPEGSPEDVWGEGPDGPWGVAVGCLGGSEKSDDGADGKTWLETKQSQACSWLSPWFAVLLIGYLVPNRRAGIGDLAVATA